jgi:hypothetical protein
MSDGVGLLIFLAALTIPVWGTMAFWKIQDLRRSGR